MGRKIFINYRRAESRTVAKLLHTYWRGRHFPERSLFLDEKGLDGSTDWLHELERQVAASAALVALIGPGWADARDAQGRRRLDDEDDYVRFEIAEAFRRGIPVIPVLINGAVMPDAAALPPNLLLLTRPQALPLRAESFDADADRVAALVKQRITEGRKGISPLIAGIGVAAALAAGILAGPFVAKQLELQLPGLNAPDKDAIVDLQKQLSEAEDARRAARDARVVALDDIAHAEARAAKAQTELAKAEGGQKEAEKARDGAQARTSDLERQIADTSARIERLQLDLTTRSADLDRQKSELKKSRDETAAEREKRLVAEKALSAAEVARKDAAQMLAAARDETKRLAASLADAKTSLTVAQKKAQDASKEQADRISILETDIANSRNMRAALKASSFVSPQAKPGPKAAGTGFRDCEDMENKIQICPEMVVIPAGSFMMGSPATEKNRYEDEDDVAEKGGTQVQVTFARPFAVGKYEITFAQWDACVLAGGCNHIPANSYERGNTAVFDVSWNDAKEYVSWLSQKTGATYRLLTEAEWEYAARSGATTRYFWGDDETSLCEYANLRDLPSQISPSDAKLISPSDAKPKCGRGNYENRVGLFKPNAFGLHDMFGNTSEWVEDCYKNNYKDAPRDGSALTAADCKSRSLRGGSHEDNATALRSAARNKHRQSTRNDYSSINAGFRVARTLTP